MQTYSSKNQYDTTGELAKLVELKKLRDTPAVTRESTNSHPRTLQERNNRPAY